MFPTKLRFKKDNKKIATVLEKRYDGPIGQHLGI